MIETATPQEGSEKPDAVETVRATGEYPSAESRLDLLTGEWTIFAPHRDDRPEEFPDNVIDTGEATHKQIECPFCAGNEKATPMPVWIGKLQAANDAKDDRVGDDWTVRVVPNKYPAVEQVDSSDMRAARRAQGSELFQREKIGGGHEVIIESRQHVQSLSELDLAEVLLVFQAYRDRLRFWRSVPGISYISTFKNVGGKAGASLRHSHSQLIATDRMPPATSASIERMILHRSATGCCLQCDLIRGEMKEKHRVVWRDDSVIAYCPFASRLPMTLRITSLAHQGCFEDLDEGSIESVSRAVYRAVSWLERIRPGTSYNYCLRTRPPGLNDPSDSFHWSIDLFPRMTQIAGFEWSSGCMINPVMPEVAASKYRACAVAEDPRSTL